MEYLIQIELQQILRDAGVRDTTDIQSLRRENQHLREELERPGHPQRSQTTVGGEAAQVKNPPVYSTCFNRYPNYRNIFIKNHTCQETKIVTFCLFQLQQVIQDQARENEGLSDALRAERDIYANLNGYVHFDIEQ